MELKAIHNEVPVTEVHLYPEVLMYNRRDGFCWVHRRTNPPGEPPKWTVFASSVSEAEEQARQAGFDPTAVMYTS